MEYFKDRYRIYKRLGAHPKNGGVDFAVWAPHAQTVSVITESNGWDEAAGMMELQTVSKGEKGINENSRLSYEGVWSVHVKGAKPGDSYRYVVTGADGIKRYKADPCAFCSELRPANASVICTLEGYEWRDKDYMAAGRNTGEYMGPLEKPMAVYEVHLGSWKKNYSSGCDGFLNYRELADQLVEYICFMGYTHIELIGICEHPFDGSWGYQVTGFFAPTRRYGNPDDFRYFVDTMHRHGIGVILDWVPAHFPKDSFGLECFDGTMLYEPEDELLRDYPEWGTRAFDHSKEKVRNFLISSAVYWVEEFHIDALRVDAVAAMIHVSFGRSEWRPNEYGGVEDITGIAFIQELNRVVSEQTGAYMIAEDSSIMAGVTDDVKDGGLGFLLKWNLGWMNDTLKYLEKDPIYRKHHHGALTYVSDYAFTENFMLVLSHDEVVHLKKPLLHKMPGGMEDKMGALKSLYTYQFTFPGKKLLFMGQDIAEYQEWDEKKELNWWLADKFGHRDVMQCIRNLIGIYKMFPSLYVDSRDSRTFEWVKRDDGERNIICYIRRNPWNYNGAILVICNFSPVSYGDYSCGVPVSGYYNRMFSTFDSLPGGGGPNEIAEAFEDENASGGRIPPITAICDCCDGYEYRLNYGLRPYESVIIALPKESSDL